jgi:hypothetical protein
MQHQTASRQRRRGVGIGKPGTFQEGGLKVLERILMGLAIGAVPPIIGLLAGWWGTFAVLPEQGVMIAALCGLAAGLIADAVLLRWVMTRADAAPWWLWAGIYIFYAIGGFGFLMGVPIFIPLLGLPAGVLIGGRLAREAAAENQVRRAAHLASAFTTAVLLIACIASATIALTDPYTAGSLEGMLGLPFEVTPPMLVGLILVGGAALVAVQWLLTGTAVRWSHAKLSREA